MKTLIHIIPTLENGGAETVLSRLVAELSKNGIVQYVITIQGDDTNFNYKHIANYCEVIHYKRTPMQVLDCFQKENSAKVLAWMYKSIYYAYRWRRRSQGEQEIIWNIRRSYFTYHQWRKKLGLFVFGLMSQIYKPRIIYCAQIAKKAHLPFGFYSLKSRVIGNRLAKKEKEQTLTTQVFPQNYLLYVGRYNKAKGPDRLLRIAKHILRENEDLALVIAGREWPEEIIPKEIKRKVMLLGNVKNLDRLYSNALVFLFTSYSEGYPNVVVEAVCQGTPVVGFEAGDSRLILEGYPYGYTVVNESTFIAKLHALLLHPPSLKERLSVAESQQSRFDFSRTVKEYQEFIWNH